MTTRESVLVFKDQGAEGVTGRVISLANALEHQKRRAAELSPILKNATVDGHSFGAMAQSSSAKITSLTNTLGPLGAGLGTVSRAAPQAAMGLLQLCAAQEKASLLQRTLNTALTGGAATMITGSLVAAAYADDALRAGDTYASLEARIRTFAEGNLAAARTQRELYGAAKDARTGVADLTTLYTRLSPAMQDFGRDQQEALAITRLTSKAMAIQGADIREQAAATIQFSQAIGSGVIRNDELRTMLEAAPQVMRYIAQNLEINGKIGVAFSSLRNLGEAGALTTERIIDALLRAGPKIEADFINAPKLSQQGWKILMDTIIHTVGALDKQVGGQKAVVAWLNEMANKADAWREAMLLNPDALDPIKDAAEFVGDAVGSIGSLGKVAVDHFDQIVMAGQAIIALKLGSVMSSWFVAAANGVQGLIGKWEAFKAAAQVQAATTAAPTSVKAAQGLRSAAAAADLRATELRTAAEIKQAQAVAARTAAYEAGNAVNRIKIQLDQTGATVAQREAAVTLAQAEAANLSAVATTAETQAKKAATAAATASAAAVTRNTVAKAAETAVTVELTGAQTALNVVKAAGLGLYNLLGGAIGLATLAIGGLVYAVWKAHEAEERLYETMQKSVDITDRLRASTDAMAAATWAEIPGIVAKTAALREQAAVQQKLQSDELRKRKADLAELDDRLKQPLSDDEYQIGIPQRAALAKDIERRGGIVTAGDQSANAARDAARFEQIIAAAKQKSDAQSQLTRGTDSSGRALTGDQTKVLKSQIEENTTFLRGEVDNLTSAIKVVDGKIKVAKADEKVGLGSLRVNLGTMKDAASEGVLSGATAPAPKTAPPKATAVAVPGGVSAAYTDLLKAGFLNLKGGEGYSAKNGEVSLNGTQVVARSDDEATALARYVKVVEALNDATDAQIKKEADKLGVTVRSKDEMKAAAGAILQREMASSKAAQADDKWADMQAQMNGESRATVKATRELNQLKDDGAQIDQKAFNLYMVYIRVQQKAADLQKGLQLASPLVQHGFDLAQADKIKPVDGRGVVDEVKATAQLMAAKAAVVLDRDRAVRAEIARRIRTGELLEQNAAKETADLLAAYDIAVEISTQDQLLELRKARLADNRQATEQQIAETSDAVITALRGATNARSLDDIADIGKRLGGDLLNAVLEELMFSPLRLQIQAAIRSLMAAHGGGGGGGLWSTVLNVVARSAGGGGSGSAPAYNPMDGAADGRVPGYANGRTNGRTYEAQMRDFIIKGKGGPRGDDELVRVSPGEAIINEASTSMSSRLLDLVNRGQIDDRILNCIVGGGFAAGRIPGGASLARPTMPYGPSAREGDVILNNNTGVPMRAERSRGSDGAMRLDLKPLFAEGVRGAARSGEVTRGLKEQQQPTRRA